MIVACAHVVQIGTKTNFDHYHVENNSFILLSLLQPLSYPPSDLARCQGFLLITRCQSRTRSYSLARRTEGMSRIYRWLRWRTADRWSYIRIHCRIHEGQVKCHNNNGNGNNNRAGSSGSTSNGNSLTRFSTKIDRNIQRQNLFYFVENYSLMIMI